MKIMGDIYMERDFSLNSGERQVAESLDGIRYDHIARYKKAIKFLKNKKNDFGLDCFCGNGYGTYYLARELSRTHIWGIDASEEAVAFANKFYNADRCMYAVKKYPFSLPKSSFDYIVSFESIEHVDNGRAMFDELIAAIKDDGHFIFSVPNQNKHPLEKKQSSIPQTPFC
jgi:2-polyprenyl-3-methyl-5-hydroxy-6-metoxy-1,4-benzoquinol methylase